MHEFGLCESFVDAVLRRAAGRRVAAVRLRIGVLHRVDEDAFRQAFEFVMLGTLAEGSTVEVVATPVLLDCPACGVETETDELLPACPACGGLSVRIAGGNELVLESIRLAADAQAPLVVEDCVPAEPDDGHTHAHQPAWSPIRDNAVPLGGG
jgi:hydrogenase nickel incorporation protein HypA/HybF